MRRFVVGAEAQADGVDFRVWAPAAQRVELEIAGEPARIPLERQPGGYWQGFVPGLCAGARYAFVLDGRGPFPDPASRFQPDGPDAASEVIDASQFKWSDVDWHGESAQPRIIYELHVGTFTKQGTWRAAMQHLAELADIGITMIEVMPVAEFAGAFGWGYDGVDLFAPFHHYGRPDDMRAFVDAAHALGIAVILDVVYNHFGPDGCYLREFSPSYISARHVNEWGDAVNFDDENATPVREFVVANAQYWMEEFHLDGLRLDATQQMFDDSEHHIVGDISRAVRRAARARTSFIVVENERQDIRYLHGSEENGYGVDAMWNDDFHHSMIVATTGARDAYLTDHAGTPQELISAIKYGFLYQGQYYSWQKMPRGTPGLTLRPGNLVNFIENHDQVANISLGRRLQLLTSPGRWRSATALLLLAPQIPMLFQGEEFASSRPFVYFADHKGDLARAVAKGRADFMAQFPAAAAARESIPRPDDRSTFDDCKLDHDERTQHQTAVALHRDLIALRRHDVVFSRLDECRIDGAVIAPEAFLLRYSGRTEERLLLFNMGPMLKLASLAEPLIAPPHGLSWQQQWSSEEEKYGGAGAAEVQRKNMWWIPAHSATVLKARVL